MYTFFIQDPHSEYPIDADLPRNPPKIESVFNAYRSDLTEPEIESAAADILEDANYALEYAYSWSEIIKITGSPKQHISLLQHYLKMMCEALKEVSGSDSYFDYYPNSVACLAIPYAKYVSEMKECPHTSTDFLQELAVLVFSPGNTYHDPDFSENCHRLLPELKEFLPQDFVHTCPDLTK